MAAISYNYTLNYQGLFSNVNCSYQPTSPIKHMSSSNDSVTYNVPSCAALGEASILTNISSFKSVLGTNTLMSWACQSAPINTQPPSYSIYLKFLGFRGGYEQDMGNITCTVSPIQPAIFPVMYQSSRRIFSVGDALSSNVLVAGPPPAFSLLLNYTLIALGSVISQGQNFDSNLVAESVITLGLKSFGLQPYAQNSTYLQLYERMIQGILEYEVCPVCDIFFFFSSFFCPTDHVHSIDILDCLRSSSVLCPRSDRVCEVRSTWLVCDECQHRLLDSNDNNQRGCYDCSPSGSDPRENCWLSSSPFPPQKCYL